MLVKLIYNDGTTENKLLTRKQLLKTPFNKNVIIIKDEMDKILENNLKHFVILDLGYNGYYIRGFENKTDALKAYNNSSDPKIYLEGNVVQFDKFDLNYIKG